MLLLDEPLGALDLKLREEMQVELKSLQQRLGITFVFVTHDQGEALSMADRVAVFSQGRIEQLDTPRGLYTRPRTAFVANFVGSANVVDAAGCRAADRPSRVIRHPAGADRPAGRRRQARCRDDLVQRHARGRALPRLEQSLPRAPRRRDRARGCAAGVGLERRTCRRAARSVRLAWRPESMVALQAG